MNKKIVVVGLGYVGLPLALIADKKGYNVIGIIRNAKNAENINKKLPPFKDNLIERLLPSSKLHATTDFKEINNASVIIICVPTPVHRDYTPDLKYIINATKNIGINLQKRQLVILESTVNPGVTEEIILPILEKESGLKAGVDFYLSHCPERINPGDQKWNVENIPRVVGSLEEIGLEKTIKFYESIISEKITPMGSLKETEAVKIVENSFRDINIAFVNELAISFSKLGIDVKKVIDGASTKPFGFLSHYPGCGVGGHCIPVDPYYLIDYAKKNGFYHHFLALARRINNQMPEYTVELLIKGLNEKGLAVKGTKITVLGLSYKANIDDDRESPAYKIIHLLTELKADLVTYDPYIPEKSTAKSLNEALYKSQALILVTAHDMFKKITPELLKQQAVQVIIDGRNFFNKQDFEKNKLIYKGIGR